MASAIKESRRGSLNELSQPFLTLSSFVVVYHAGGIFVSRNASVTTAVCVGGAFKAHPAAASVHTVSVHATSGTRMRCLDEAGTRVLHASRPLVTPRAGRGS